MGLQLLEVQLIKSGDQAFEQGGPITGIERRNRRVQDRKTRRGRSGPASVCQDEDRSQDRQEPTDPSFVIFQKTCVGIRPVFGRRDPNRD